ncbi:hypothetical protein B0H19DRAFT_1263028 [Mycena capillaripes]|nr:hypothetical protein B0H19DRAFT_1263028 [Mycena capillaripes]
MHFAAKNYLRIIVSIAALARAIVVFGIPIANAAPAVEDVTARNPIIFGYPVWSGDEEPKDTE